MSLKSAKAKLTSFGLTLALVLGVVSPVFFAQVAKATTTGTVTNTKKTTTGGGGQTIYDCSANTILYQINAQNISFDGSSSFGQMYGTCQPISSDGTQRTGTTNTIGNWGSSSNAGGAVVDSCTSSQVIVGLRAYKTTNGYVSGIKLLCGQLPLGTSNSWNAGVIGVTGSNTYQDLLCDSGTVAVGMDNDQGSIVDKVGIRCAPVLNVSQTVTFGSPGNKTLNTGTFTVSASSTGPGSVSFSSSNLPVCTVSGTTVTLLSAGTCTLTATAASTTNYSQATASQSLTVSSTLSISTPASGLTATIGSAYSLSVSASGGTGSYTYAVASGTLPGTLSLNTSTGAITGTTSSAGTYNISVSATDGNGVAVNTSSFTITSQYVGCVPSTDTSSSPGYTIVKFTSTNTCNWTTPSNVTKADVLVVGAGGGGGNDNGGGGGGGQVKENLAVTMTSGATVTITVGIGGLPGCAAFSYTQADDSNLSTGCKGAKNTGGNTGGSSSFVGTSTITSLGGNGAVGRTRSAADQTGWDRLGYHGGGVGINQTETSNPTAGANTGGGHSSDNTSSGGGGGAGGVGTAGSNSSVGGTGGAGLTSAITGLCYGGGGGGGSQNGTPGTATCGGSNGTGTSSRNNASANLGGGGGGGGNVGGVNGGTGGSGIVVIRYVSASSTPTFSTVSNTTTGFTVNITNYNSSYSYSYSASPTATVTPGTASGNTLPLTITGLTAGQSSTITVSTSANGFTSSATVSGTATTPLTPTFGTISYGSGTITIPVTNYDANFTFTATPSYSTGTGTISYTDSGSTRSYLITPGTSGATVSLTVTTQRSGYNNGTATTSSYYAGCTPTSTVSGSYTIVKFTTSTTCNWTVPTGITKSDILVVGGGGSGGTRAGGGGGAGGYLYFQGQSLTPGQVHTVVVGSGGVANQYDSGTNGGDSSFGALTVAKGGGGGGGALTTGNTARAGKNGGSGGGAAGNVSLNGSTYGTGTVGQGNDGAPVYYSAADSYQWVGGGGGGAGSAGFMGTHPYATSNANAWVAGKGGSGVLNSITGSAVCYATGGGGGLYSAWTGGPAGDCGGAANPNGGAGTAGAITPSAPTANTGAGGGASGYNASGADAVAANGASGIVVIKYLSSALTPTFDTPVSTTSGFTVNVTNYDPNVSFTYSSSPAATVTPGVASGSTLPLTITGLTAGQSSIITVSTSANGFNGSATVSGSAFALASAPTSLSATPGNGQLTISFTAGATGGSSITNYKYSTDGTNYTAFSTPVTTSPVVVTGLTNGTSYTIYLKAVTAAGDGAASTSVTATPVTTPSAPTSLVATRGNGQLSIAFTAGATGGSSITNYKYSTDGTNYTAFSTPITSSPVVITGLTNGTSYTIYLKAVNAVGDGAASTSVTATPYTTPGAPTGLALTSSNTSVSLSWTAPSSTGGNAISDYLIEYQLKGASSWSTFAHTASSSTSISVTSLTANLAYNFRVSAVNGAGTGSASAIRSTMTIAGMLQYLDASDSNSYTSGTTWTDLTGKGYNATLNGSPTFSTDKFTLNGTNQYFSVGSTTTFGFSSTSDFTISVLFSQSQATAGPFGLYTKWNNSVGGDWALQLSNGKLLASRNYSPWTYTQAQANDINRKYLATYSYTRATSTIRLYLNGTLLGSATVPTSTYDAVPLIGATFTNSVVSSYFKGDIYSASVFDNALTLAQIQALFANLQPTSKVVFSANTGSGTMADQSFTNGNSATLSSNSFTKTGYSFSGWNTAADGSGTSYSDAASATLYGDTYLYAQWSANALTVTYDSQSGSAISSGSTTTGGQISTSPGTPTRSGYAFLGWFTAATGGTAITFPYTHNLTASFTLYAQWVVTYSITVTQGSNGTISPGTSLISSGNSATFTFAPASGYAVSNIIVDGTALSTNASPNLSNLQTAIISGYTFTNVTATHAITATYVPIESSNLLIYLDATKSSSLAGASGVTSPIWTSIAPGSTAPSVAGSATSMVATDAVTSPNLPKSVYLNNAGSGTTNGTGSYFNYGKGTGTQIGTNGTSAAVTVEMWINPKSFRANTSTPWNILLTKWFSDTSRNSSSSSEFHFAIKYDGTSLKQNVFTSSCSDKYGSKVFTSTSADLNKWALVGFTVDLSGNLQFYLNGKPDGSAYTGCGITARSNALVFVGDLVQGAGFDGSVSIVRLYNTALSASSMLNNYNTDALIFAKSPIFNVSFNYNNATGGNSTASSDFTYGGTAITLPNPTRTGYTLSGWYDQISGGTKIADGSGSYSPSASTTLYAQWSANTNTVIFNANGGTGTIANQTINTASATALTSNTFTRTGYTFAGWNTNADGTSGTSYTDGQSVTISSGMTLYAKWTANNYTVTYSYNGADGGNSSASGSFTTGGTAITLPTPTKTGYSFAGWYSDSGLTTSIGAGGASYSPAGATTSVTIYAKWSLNNYSITYNGNSNSSGSAPSSGSADFNSTYTVASNSGVLVRTGYTFGGWNTLANGSGTNYTAGTGSLTMGSANLTLYAKWNINTYTVTYDGNSNTGGTVPVDASSPYNYNSTVTAKNNSGTLVRNGYTFAGWNTAANGSGTDYAANGTATFTLGAANVTLYAKWTANSYTVTYSYNSATGGNTTTTSSYTSGGTAITLPTPTRTGYSFEGWYSDSGFSNSIGGAGASYSPTGATLSITVYAKWASINYSVTYTINGGSGTAPTETAKTIGAAFSVKSIGAVTKTGYDFTGWSDGTNTYQAGTNNYTMGSANVVFVAQWTRSVYTVTYSANSGTGSGSRSSDSYTYGDAAITLPSIGTLARTGYSFGGWSLTNNGSAISGTYTPTQSITIYAVWNPNTYTITYNRNGASGSVTNGDTSYTTSGTAATLPTVGTMTKTGYNFAGWSTSANGVVIGTSTYTTTANVTLYAIWNIKNLSITYNKGLAGGVTPTLTLFPSNSSGNYGTTFNVSSTIDSMTSSNNYAFSGWSDGTNIYAKNDLYRIGDSNITLTAQWTAIYAVRYYATGGALDPADAAYDSECTQEPTDHKCSNGQAITVNANPTRTGYTFAGWKDQSGNAISNSTNGWSISSTSYLAYATWTADNYSAVYKSDGADQNLDASTYHIGDLITVKPGITKTGYVFNGWLYNGQSYAENSTIQIGSASIEFVAQWSAINYNLVYDSNGGSAVATPSSTKTYQSSFTTANAPTRDGYTFASWSDGSTTKAAGSSVSMPAQDVTYTAQWTANNYSVSYDPNGGTGTPTSLSNKHIGDTFTVGSAPSLSNRNFLGWSDGSNTYMPGQSYTVRSSNVSLTATWSGQLYTVTYLDGGGSGSIPTEGSHLQGESFAIETGAGLSRTGFAFDGWDDGNGHVYAHNDSFTVGGSNVTLTAKWRATQYFVSYSSGTNASTHSDSTFNIGGSAIKLPTPTRANYVFEGWYDASSGGNKIGNANDDYSPAATKTLYGRWTQASLYGVTSSLTELDSYTTNNLGDRSTNLSYTGGSISVRVPNGALPTGTVVKTSLVGDLTRVKSLIANNNNYILNLVVSWLASDTTVPDTDPNKPITMTVTSSSIKKGAAIYSVVGTTATLLGYAAQDGSADVTLYSDPEIAILAIAPDAPTSVTASPGNASASISWSAPSNVGGAAITGYTVTSSGGQTCTTTGTTSCTVSGLTNGTGYTFTVTATNSAGTSSPSSVSSSVTPQGSSAISISTSSTGTYGTAQTITATLTNTNGSVNFKLDGTSISGCGTVQSSSLSATCSWTPTAVNSSAAITAELTPSTQAYSSSSSSTVNVNVGARAITIDAANKSAAYTGNPVSVTNSYSITSGSLYGSDAIGSISYGYSTSNPTNAGTYTITPSNAVFSGGSASNYSITYTTGTLTISTSSLIVALGAAPTGVTLGETAGTHSVSATTTPSGIGAITFSSTTTSVCTVNSSTGALTILTSGTCTITADNSGDGNYSAASQDSQSFNVAPIVITFDANGASSATNTQNITDLNAANLTTNSFTRTGYTFSGWNTVSGGTGTAYSDGASITTTSDLTLYAQWTAQQSSNSNSNSNSTPAPEPIPVTSKPSHPVVPAAPEVVTPSAPVTNAADGTSVIADYSNTMTLIDGVMKEGKLTVVDTTKVVTETQGIKLELQILSSTFQPVPVTNEVQLTLEHTGIAQFAGNGFKPTTTVKVWLFSDPIYLGEYAVDKNGKFNASFLVLESLPVGEHLLQINGVTGDSKLFSQSIPVVVKAIETQVKPVDPTTPEEKPVTPVSPDIKKPLVTIYFKNTSAKIDNVIIGNFKKYASKIKGAKSITCVAYKISSKYSDKLVTARAKNVCSYLNKNFGGVVKVYTLPISKAATKSLLSSKTRNGRVDVMVVK